MNLFLYLKTGADHPEEFWCPKNKSVVQTFPIRQDFEIFEPKRPKMAFSTIFETL